MKNYINVLVNGGDQFRNDALRMVNERERMIYELIDYITAENLSKNLRALIFPAGYFCAKDRKSATKIATRVSRKIFSKGCKFKVIWGIDLVAVHAKKKNGTNNDKLPYYGFALQPGQKKPIKFQQVSATAKGGLDPHVEKSWGNRPVCIPGSKEAMLICGESWNSRLLEKVQKAAPKVLIIIAHQNVNLQRNSQGWGKMSWHLNLNKFKTKTGIPIILSEHTRSPLRHKYAWPSNKTRKVNLPPEMDRLFTAKLTQI
jgi:hypothetical protein